MCIYIYIHLYVYRFTCGVVVGGVGGYMHVSCTCFDMGRTAERHLDAPQSYPLWGYDDLGGFLLVALPRGEDPDCSPRGHASEETFPGMALADPSSCLAP